MVSIETIGAVGEGHSGGASEIDACAATGLDVPVAFVPAELGGSWHDGPQQVGTGCAREQVGACTRIALFFSLAGNEKGMEKGITLPSLWRENRNYLRVIALANRADWIRTSDLLTPSQTRYQTALRPELSNVIVRVGHCLA